MMVIKQNIKLVFYKFEWTTPIYVFLLFSLSLIFSLFFIRAEMPRLLEATFDGAGYYLQVARNIATGNGITFDGLHETNGFHPLWMVCLVAVFKLFGGTPEFFYRATGVIVSALIAIASFLFYRGLRCILPGFIAAASGFIYATLVFNNINLMESALVLVTTSSLLLFTFKYKVFESYRSYTSFIFGLLLGLAILARLDNSFLAVVIGLFCVVQGLFDSQYRKNHLNRLLYIVAGSSLLVLPYFLFNYFSYGSIIPISGRLETGQSRESFIEIVSIVRNMDRLRTITLMLGFVYLIWYFWRLLSKRMAKYRPQMVNHIAAVTASAALIHAANEILFMKWQLYWHFTLIFPLAGILLAIGFNQIQVHFSGRRAQMICVAIYLLFIAFLAIRVVNRVINADIQNGGYSLSYETSLWIQNNIPKNSVLAMKSPEVVGFFSDRKTIDLSGLCNNFEFQKVLQEHRLQSYLSKNRVQYWVELHLPVPEKNESDKDLYGFYSDSTGTGTIQIESGLFGVESEPVVFSQTDEVFRSRPYFKWGEWRNTVIWRFHQF